MGRSGGGGIAFVRLLPGLGGQVITMGVDATEVRQLTGQEGHGECYGPGWSVDGGRIAFTDGGVGNVVKLRLDDEGRALGGPIQVAPGYAKYPTWSPDGKYIAYSDETATRKCTVFVARIVEVATGTV